MQLISWVKKHTFISLLLFVVCIVLIVKYSTNFPQPLMMQSSISSAPSFGYRDSFANSKISGEMAQDITTGMMVPPDQDFAPIPNNQRMVVSNSFLSLLVKNVVDTRDNILDFVTTQGGYMVSSSTSNPQEQANATITIRIPSKSLESALAFFRQQAIKVVSEELTGTDVTDEFVDIETRIAQLDLTKSKMNELLDKAQEVSDLMNINSQISAIQQQIDSLKGRQLSLSQNAALSKITVYLSTDELSLPYAPENPFRPEVIVKLAIRSLLTHLQTIASYIIWIGVYAVVWIPMALVAFFLYRRFNR